MPNKSKARVKPLRDAKFWDPKWGKNRHTIKLAPSVQELFAKVARKWSIESGESHTVVDVIAYCVSKPPLGVTLMRMPPAQPTLPGMKKVLTPK